MPRYSILAGGLVRIVQTQSVSWDALVSPINEAPLQRSITWSVRTPFAKTVVILWNAYLSVSTTKSVTWDSIAPKVADFVDTFDGPSLDPRWTVTTGAPTIVSGRLRLNNAVATSVQTGFVYNLTNSSAYVKLDVSGATVPRVSFILSYDYTGLAPQYPDYRGISLQIYGGNISFGVNWTGVLIPPSPPYNGNLAYNPVAHAYLRLRESGGYVYADFSPDGITWTQGPWAVTANSWPITQTKFYIATDAQGGAGAGYIYADNLNYHITATKTTAVTWSIAGTITKTDSISWAVNTLTINQYPLVQTISWSTKVTVVSTKSVTWNSYRSVTKQAIVTWQLASLHIQDFVDTFDGPGFDPRWTTTGGTLTGGRLEQTGAAFSQQHVYSDYIYNFNSVSGGGGNHVFVKLTMLGSAGSAGPVLRVDATGGRHWEFRKVGNTVFIYDDNTAIGSFVYDPAVHVYWKLRQQSGTIFWLTSVDGITWTQRASNFQASLGPLDGVRIVLENNMGSGGAGVAWDNLNTSLKAATSTAVTWYVNPTVTAVVQSYAVTWTDNASTVTTYSSTWVTYTSFAQDWGTAWIVSEPLAVSAAVSWTTSQAVALAADAAWLVLEQVSTAIASTWLAAADVSQTYVSDWLVREFVAQTASVDWAAAFTVGTEYLVEWLASYYGSTFYTVGWQVAGQTSTTATVGWLDRAAVSRYLAVDWITEQRISCAQGTTWDTLRLVTVTRSLVWMSGSQPVTVVRSVSWRARLLVGGTEEIGWTIRRAVPTGLSASWTVRALVAGTHVAEWADHTLVARTATAGWVIRAVVVTESDTAWLVLLAVSTDAGVSWWMTGVGAVFPVLWQTRRRLWVDGVRQPGTAAVERTGTGATVEHGNLSVERTGGNVAVDEQQRTTVDR